MTYQITDRCRVCGLCATLCPAQAIVLGKRHYEIDSEKCLRCGLCAARCPRSAVQPAHGG